MLYQALIPNIMNWNLMINRLKNEWFEGVEPHWAVSTNQWKDEHYTQYVNMDGIQRRKLHRTNTVWTPSQDVIMKVLVSFI